MTISKINNAREPNFKRIYRYANEMLVLSSAIDTIPFKVKGLVREQADIAFCTFEKAKSKYHQDIRQFGSDSAVLMEMQGAYIIFYNQDEAPCRVRFSIMHEFGHYVLGHELNLTREDTQDSKTVKADEDDLFINSVVMEVRYFTNGKIAKESGFY